MSMKNEILAIAACFIVAGVLIYATAATALLFIFCIVAFNWP